MVPTGHRTTSKTRCHRKKRGSGNDPRTGGDGHERPRSFILKTPVEISLENKKKNRGDSVGSEGALGRKNQKHTVLPVGTPGGRKPGVGGAACKSVWN